MVLYEISMCLGSTARQWSPTDIGAAWLEPIDRAGDLGRRVDPLDPRAGAPARFSAVVSSNVSFTMSIMSISGGHRVDQ